MKQDKSFSNLLKVTMDITPLRGNKTGVGNYVHYLLKFLLQTYPNLVIQGLSFGFHRFSNETKELIHKLKLKKHIPVPTRIFISLWKVFPIVNLDTLIQLYDVYHATNYYLPPLRKTKSVLTIYDLSFIKTPQYADKKIYKLFAPTIKSSAYRATRIITCSNYSKKDIIELLNIPEEKIVVAYPGFDTSIFFPSDKEESRKLIKTKYNIDKPFLLFIGTIEERKNVIGLLDIFNMTAKQIPHYLVIIGKKGHNWDSIRDHYQKLPNADSVIFIDYLTNHSDLRHFYNSADLFIFPSFDEGFGMPVLEAMASGCPVISSNRGALPEVVGDEGISLDPEDLEAFSDKIIQLLNSPSLYDKMRNYYLQQASKFNWTETAKIHYETYIKIAETNE